MIVEDNEETLNLHELTVFVEVSLALFCLSQALLSFLAMFLGSGEDVTDLVSLLLQMISCIWERIPQPFAFLQSLLNLLSDGDHLPFVALVETSVAL